MVAILASEGLAQVAVSCSMLDVRPIFVLLNFTTYKNFGKMLNFTTYKNFAVLS